MEDPLDQYLEAVKRGNCTMVSSLLDADSALLEEVDHRGRTPLALAAYHGQLGMVKLLVQRGANIGATGGYDMTALHSAAAGGHKEVVAFLLCNGAQPNVRDDHGYVPFMLASAEGHVGVVEMLVEHTGVQGLGERTDLEGTTALHCAAYWGRDTVVKFLLLAGADTTIRNNAGKTPRTLAEENELMGDDEDEQMEIQRGRIRCLAEFEWWKGELERRHVLFRATCVHKTHATQRDKPTSKVPAYLEARVAAGHPLPFVEVVLPQPHGEQEEKQADSNGKRKAEDESSPSQGPEAGEEEEMHAVLEYVLTELNADLVTELLDGLHTEK